VEIVVAHLIWLQEVCANGGEQQERTRHTVDEGLIYSVIFFCVWLHVMIAFVREGGKRSCFQILENQQTNSLKTSWRQPFRSFLLSCVCLSSASHSACLSQPILPLLSEFGAASISRQFKAIVDRHLSHGKCESVAVRGDAD
jgi:hypothetical protein